MCENQDILQQHDTETLEYELIDIEWSLDYGDVSHKMKYIRRRNTL